MDSPKPQFDWVEYLSFIVMLALSALIGIYFGFIKGGQNTISGYLLGGKQMSVFPISMSLIASYISGITLLGVPTEIYTYGTQYLMANFANYMVCFIIMIVMLPIYYKLQLISLNEYLEMRFSKSVRLIVSFLYTIAVLAYVPLVIYGPALALNQVSGLNIHLITPIVCSICIFYTTLGGLKAVVWSDALQGMVMVGSVFAVMFLGVREVGGIGRVLEIANEGERLEFFNMNPDPTVRLTFWTTMFGYTFNYLSYFAISPSTVQRFISLPTYKQAQCSLICLGVGVSIFTFSSGFVGLIIYAEYNGCDPLTSKVISRPDQILPLYVLKIGGQVRGLPGLFLAGIVSAALSSMSTCLNSVAGTLYEDFLEPMFPKKPTEKTASYIMKVLVVVFGFICVFLVTIMEKLGAILEISAGFGGVTGGASLGIFLLGFLFPWANTKGALCGGIVSLITMSWLLVGTTMAKMQGLITHPTKPLSVEACPFNVTVTPPPTPIPDGYLFPAYRLSFFYYSLTGCLIVMTVGVLVSLITGPNDPATVNPDLISPVAQRFLPKESKYNVVPLTDSKIKDNSHYFTLFFSQSLP